MAFMVRLNPVTPTREIFILAGESNMSGRGVLADLPTFPYAYKVKNYKNSAVWAAAVEPIDDPAGQVDSVSADTSPAAGASPSLSFGSSLAALRPYNEVGLVPCAKGSTTIANWQKSGLSRSTLYGSMVARALEAAPTGVLKGVFWWQGANDASNQTAAQNLASNTLAMFSALRTDLSLPDLKFVVAGLGPSTGATYWSTVQTQLQSLDGALSGDVAWIQADDLPTKLGDTVHIATAGLVTLGARAATAMNTLLA